MLLLLVSLAVQQQQSATPQQQIARIVVTPASRTMTAGDTMRLRAEARDAQGNVIPGVTFRYRLGSGARFEGRVDSLGLVTAGSTAILPVTVTATSPTTKPKFDVIEIKAVPGPAASIEIGPGVEKLVSGQRLRYIGRVYSASGDQRYDAVSWASSNPAVASVSSDGLVTAHKAGSTTLTGSVGNVKRTKTVQVIGG